MAESIDQFIASTAPFSDLPKKELKKIAQNITTVELARGADICRQGDSVIGAVLLINKGRFEVSYEENGQKLISGYLGAGDIFGGISVMVNSAVPLRTVTALEDVAGYAVPTDAFLSICSRYKNFRRHFVDLFAKRMQDESYSAIVSSSKAFRFLSEVIPFTFLPEETIESIITDLTRARFKKGTILFIQGQTPVEHIYIVEEGAVERYFEDKNQKTLRGRMGEGDLYGGISMMLNDGIAVRTLRVQEDASFYLLPKDSFFKLCKEHETFSAYFTDTFGKRMVNRSYASIINRTNSAREEDSQFFNQSIKHLFSKTLVACHKDISIQDAAKEMSAHNCSSIFVRDDEETVIGVATDNDLRRKVISVGYDIHRPIADIMSQKVFSIPDQTMVFEALNELMRHTIKHLAVTDSSGKVIGVVTNRDLLAAQGQSPFFLIKEIRKATLPEHLFDKHRQLPAMVHHLITSGAKAKNVTTLITTVSEVILKKLIRFAIEELGEPPCAFAFMILGSEGRREQTLKTDQDNAIVYEDVPEESHAKVRDYFLKLGETVCAWLDQAGYALCKGDVMAQNPQWCQPFSVWKEYFSAWIFKGDGQDLLKSNIFFDFRWGYGDKKMIRRLREHLFSSLEGRSAFFRNLTVNALRFRPPIGFFNNFVVESKGKHKDAFDVKTAMTPIIDFARLYALRNNIPVTNTLERLEQLYLTKALSWEHYNEIEKGYSFLMQLRFVRQVTAVIEENEAPNNFINPKALTRIEQKMLKEIFKRIERFQSKMSIDFTGMA